MALRVLGGGAVYLAVAAAFGGVDSPRIVIALAVVGTHRPGVLHARRRAAPRRIKKDNAFNVMFRFVVVPMMLFAGTYFPIDRLPEWAQVVAVITPLWHGTAARPQRDARHLGAAAEPRPPRLPAGSGSVTGIALACWRFRVRLTK